MTRLLEATCAAVLAAAVGGCGSMGGLFGGDADAGGDTRVEAPADASRVGGTVRSVDATRRVIELGGTGSTAQLRETRTRTLGYDGDTVVEYRGERYRPEDLEAGDQIEARTERVNDRAIARTITVVSDATPEATSGSTVLPREFDALVRYVDPKARTIEVEPLDRSIEPVVLPYDENTRVEYQGSSYRPEDVERGARVRVRTRDAQGQSIVADILVTQDVRTEGAVGSDEH
ncbi:MAG: hypothetical protein IT532_16510 [Burkholderiales bacterium]|nr:hypothetical protein [Burkholderiales bacterium]